MKYSQVIVSTYLGNCRVRACDEGEVSHSLAVGQLGVLISNKWTTIRSLDSVGLPLVKSWHTELEAET